MEAYPTVKGQIVIPAELRRKFKNTEKTRILIVDNGNEIILRPMTEQYLRSLQGSLKGSNAVREMISSAEKGETNLAMCVTNLGEVWYTIACDQSPEVADHYVHIVCRMAIEIVEVDGKLTRQAAEYKERAGMSYADCFAAALTKIRNAAFVTGDKEFKKMESEIKVSWL